MQKPDVVIIGAGAAGLMCALRAGQRGLNVLVLDHAVQAGSKILISGGGHCNFTNLNVGSDRYLSQNPHFCKSALKGFSPNDFTAMLRKHKIAFHEKTLGQLFCNGSAREILDMLLAECRDARVDIRLKQNIRAISKTIDFIVKTDVGAIETPSLVLATGGLSIPKIGATNFTHRVAHQFGMPLVQPRPALVPLVFEGEEFAFLRDLSGLSLPVEVSCGKMSFRESMIFTHRGLSGPAILQISSYWKEGEPITINLLPDIAAEELLLKAKMRRPKAGLKAVLSDALPQRLVQAVVERYFSPKPVGEMPNKELQQIAQTLQKWRLTPSGTEGYAKAEATLGGIDTTAMSSKTMEANDVPGLYVIGEALDITGWLGGYNLHWAWASGWAAGSALRKRD